jgi:transcriptional regulator with XRE-family HTH domain
MKNKDNVIAKRIKEIRTLRGLNQTELAKKLGIKSSMVSHYETGRYIPSVENLKKIAEILDISIDHLLFEEIPYIPLKRDVNEDLTGFIYEIKNLSEKDQEMIKHMITSLIKKNN